MAACAQLGLLFSATDALTGTPSFGWLLIETTLMLGGVCLLAWVVIRFGLSRLGGPSLPPTLGKLERLDRLAIDAKRSIQVIRAGKKVFLVGVSEGQITLLSELDADEWTAAPHAGAQAVGDPSPATPSSFAGVLRRLRRDQPEEQSGG